MTGIRDPGCEDGARREFFPRESGTQLSPTVWPMGGQVAEVVCPHWTEARPLQKPIGRATESGGRRGRRGGSRVGRRAPRASGGHRLRPVHSRETPHSCRSPRPCSGSGFEPSCPFIQPAHPRPLLSGAGGVGGHTCPLRAGYTAAARSAGQSARPPEALGSTARPGGAGSSAVTPLRPLSGGRRLCTGLWRGSPPSPRGRRRGELRQLPA